MPRAEADDNELYEMEITDRRSTLEAVIAECKWLVEFTTLLALYAAVATVVTVLVKRLIKHGPDTKLLCGIVATISIAWLLYWPVTRVVELGAESLLYRLRRLLRIPYDFENRNTIYRSIWRAILSTIQITAIWGTGLLGAELIKNASLPL